MSWSLIGVKGLGSCGHPLLGSDSLFVLSSACI